MDPRWLRLSLLASLLIAGCDSNPNGPSAPSAPSLPPLTEPGKAQAPAKGKKPQVIPLRQVGEPIGATPTWGIEDRG